MKHKVKVQVPVEKKGIFGIKKTVMETRTIEVDGKTYKKMKKQWDNRPYSYDACWHKTLDCDVLAGLQ